MSFMMIRIDNSRPNNDLKSRNVNSKVITIISLASIVFMLIITGCTIGGGTNVKDYHVGSNERRNP